MLTYGQTFTGPATHGISIDFRWEQAVHHAWQMGGELLPGPPRLVELEPPHGGMRELALSWPVVRVVQW